MSSNSDFFKNSWLVEVKALGSIFLLESAVAFSNSPKHPDYWDEVNPYAPAIIPTLALCYFVANYFVYSYFINQTTWPIRTLIYLSVCQLTILLAGLSQCHWNWEDGIPPHFLNVTNFCTQHMFIFHAVKVAISIIYLCYKSRQNPSELHPEDKKQEHEKINLHNYKVVLW